ncbi:MAG: methyltransferase domain-containing protein [Candidatus Kuenenia sp.]|nr:methyltransferase domain-containing protein [Candidatus Kuenenia hertensis]
MQKYARLDLINNWEQENGIMENYIKKKASDNGAVQILEAGCGQKWPLNLNGMRYVITGVDLDKAALEIRKNSLNDLHKMVEGDLRYLKLQENHFDVIYNSYVLEHIKGAEQVLNNFIRWLKSGGIIIIRIPNPYSVKGFITRITPHWFHIFYHRNILGRPNAGKAGYAPYPVHYEPVVSRAGMHEFCRKNNITILAEYGIDYAKPGKNAFKLLIHSFIKTVAILSFGVLSSRHSNLLYILKK